MREVSGEGKGLGEGQTSQNFNLHTLTAHGTSMECNLCKHMHAIAGAYEPPKAAFGGSYAPDNSKMY